VQNRQFIWDHIYIYINIYLLTALKCIIYSMTCRGSELDAVCTFKIVTLINSLKICYLQYDVSKLCCGGREYI
jgi:hypothetical protein